MFSFRCSPFGIRLWCFYHVKHFINGLFSGKRCAGDASLRQSFDWIETKCGGLSVSRWLLNSLLRNDGLLELIEESIPHLIRDASNESSRVLLLPFSSSGHSISLHSVSRWILFYRNGRVDFSANLCLLVPFDTGSNVSWYVKTVLSITSIMFPLALIGC